MLPGTLKVCRSWSTTLILGRRYATSFFLIPWWGLGSPIRVWNKTTRWGTPKWPDKSRLSLESGLLIIQSSNPNPLYIGGDSYSGLVVPVVAQQIAKADQDGDELLYNVKGYLVGNPATDPKFDDGAFVPYAHGMGLISDELYESAKKSCGGEYANPSNEQCANYLQSINECIEGINTAQILEPLCLFVSPKPKIVAAYKRRLLKEDVEEFPLLESDLPLCKRCNYDLPYTNDIPSSVKYHLNLTSRGYRALVYSGDHDMSISFVGTQAWIRSLNFSIVDDWRQWSADGQIAGFTRTCSNNLTFAIVEGAGHTAPEYHPKERLAMFQRWIDGAPL